MAETTNTYEVVLAHEETGDLVTWQGEAADEHGAAQEAQEAKGLEYVIQDVNLLTEGEDESNARFPDIEVELEQDAGDAFMVISRVRSALRLARQPKETVDEFTAEAMEAHPSRVLDIVGEWVTVK